MKKTLLIFIAAVASAFMLTACEDEMAVNQPVATDTAQTTQTAQPQSQTPELIGEDIAKEIALERAGLTETDVSFVSIELDRDDGVWKYEIDFRQGTTEYETEINAQDGTILAWETDKK